MQSSINSYSPLYAKSLRSSTAIVSRYLKDAFATKRQLRAIACLLFRGHDGNELKGALRTNTPWKVITQIRDRGFEIPSTPTPYFRKNENLGWHNTYKLSVTDRQKLAQLVHDSKSKQGRVVE